ncbi:MAG TPA: hypothetical protein VF070_13210 [Streptosporangiaceae bacterium]
MTVQEIRAGALARMRERRHPPEFKTVTVGGDQVRIQLDTPAYLGAVDVAEWFDDRIAGLPVVPGLACEVAFAIAAAGREGEKTAVAAVRQARMLTEADQYRVFATLGGWQGRDMHRDAWVIMSAVLREWRRLGLADSPPEAEEVTIRTVNEPDLHRAEEARRGRVRYATPHGQPAGLASWLR